MNAIIESVAGLLLLIIFYLAISDEGCKKMLTNILALLLGVRIFWMWIDFYLKYNGL